MNINKIVNNLKYYDVIIYECFLNKIEIYTTECEKILINNVDLVTKFWNLVSKENINNDFISIDNGNLLVRKKIEMKEYINEHRRVIYAKLLYDEPVVVNHGIIWHKFIVLGEHSLGDYYTLYLEKDKLTESFTTKNLSIIEEL